jgi:hypothetical protein
VNTVVPFYEDELPKRGWTEDQTSAKTPVVRFTRGEFVLTITIDAGAGGYSLTVDRFAPTPSPSPTAGSTASPSG